MDVTRTPSAFETSKQRSSAQRSEASLVKEFDRDNVARIAGGAECPEAIAKSVLICTKSYAVRKQEGPIRIGHNSRGLTLKILADALSNAEVV
jgi:hypothetical protein